MIKATGLTKIYRTQEVETIALNQVDLEIKAGEFIAIMGPSGCGKTTLLNLLGIIDQPTSGEYYFNDISIRGLSEKQHARIRKNNIGFVFQSFNLIDELTVYENVELPLVYLGISGSRRKKRVEEELEKMDLINRKKHFPQQLSGGQQQRVAVARATITNPKLILADEPTGNIDSVQGKDVMELLSRLNEEGTTVIIATHSQANADYADKILNLFDGKIVSEKLI